MSLNIIVSHHNPLIDKDVIIASKRTPIISILKEINLDSDIVLVRAPNYHIRGNVRLAVKYVDPNTDLTVLCGNERCDQISHITKALPDSDTDDTIRGITHNITHLYVVYLNPKFAKWLVKNYNYITDEELFKALERSIRTGKFLHGDGEKCSITPSTIFPSPLGVDVRDITSRDELYKINHCVKPDDLIPAAIDRVYYFFGIIVIFISILVVIFAYLISRRLRLIETRNSAIWKVI